jgi:hypothetical protein
MSEKKKVETNDVYENISNSLDTTFDGEEVEELVEVKDQSDKCKELFTSDCDDTKLVDEDYIREEVKSLVDNIEVAMTKLQQDIRIGSPARQHEVFGQLANAKANVLKELITMNKVKMDAKLKIKKKEVPKNMTVNNTNVNLSSSDLLKMVNSAKKKNSLKNIEAKFDIESEKNLE